MNDDSNNKKNSAKGAESGEDLNPGPDQDKMTSRALVTVIYVLMGNFAGSYSRTAVNSPGDLIQAYMNDTSVSRGDGPLSSDTLTSLYGLLSAIFAIGGCVGAVCTQKVAQWTGRKRLVWLYSVLGVVSAAMMGVCKLATSHELLFAGRVLSGLSAGFASGLAPIYITETLPRRLVGNVMVSNTLVLQMGGGLVGVVGFEEIAATADLWVIMVGSCGVFSLIQLCLAPIAMPSPFYLLLKSRTEEATKALQKLRGRSDVHEEVSRLQDDIKARAKKKQLTILQLLRSSKQRKKTLVVAASFVSFHFTGLIIVLFYSVTMLQSAGLNDRTSRYVATAVTFTGVAVSVLMIFLIHRFPRRKINLAGLGGLFLSGGVLSISLIFADKAPWLHYVGVLAILGMAASHSVGPAPVAWLMVAELYDDSARGAASSLCTMVWWLSLFTIGYAFPPMQESLGNYTVLPFVGFSAFFFVFFLVLQPESLRRRPKAQEIAVFAINVAEDQKREDIELQTTSNAAPHNGRIGPVSQNGGDSEVEITRL